MIFFISYSEFNYALLKRKYEAIHVPNSKNNLRNETVEIKLLFFRFLKFIVVEIRTINPKITARTSSEIGIPFEIPT